MLMLSKYYQKQIWRISKCTLINDVQDEDGGKIDVMKVIVI